jgi:hypothetical protein
MIHFNNNFNNNKKMKTKNYQLKTLSSQLFLIIALALFTLTGCKQAPKNNSGDEITKNTDITEDLEKQAMEMVFALSEVQAIEDVSVLSYGMNEDSACYSIGAGTNTETHFSAWYHFNVYVKPQMEIKYYDARTDEELSLDEWREQLKMEQEEEDYENEEMD